MMWWLTLAACLVGGSELDAWMRSRPWSTSDLALTRVEGGTFDMGCTPGQDAAGYEWCDNDELPIQVTLTYDVFISVYEVQQSEYQFLTGSDPSLNGECWDCPVDSVSWQDAARFLNALSEADGYDSCFACQLTGCTTVGSPYECTGYRLPTEAEWERAARCGADFPFSGSDVLDEVAWWEGNVDPHQGASPVGTKRPNDCGLYDMTGNVYEWVWDGSDAVEDGGGGPEYSLTDPIFEPDGEFRRLKGGSYKDSDSNGALRVGSVVVADPFDSAVSIGFRVARTSNIVGPGPTNSSR